MNQGCQVVGFFVVVVAWAAVFSPTVNAAWGEKNTHSETVSAG